jgi:membrane protein
VSSGESRNVEPVPPAVKSKKEWLDSAKRWFDDSLAGRIWARLSELDFINQALLLAGVMTLWLIPALIVLDRVRGRSSVDTVSQRMGLNAEASSHVSGLFNSGAPSSAVTAGAIAVVVFGLLGAAGAVERLYELAFRLEGRGARDLWRRLVWPAALIASVSAMRALTGELKPLPAALLLIAVVSFALLVPFFWWSMHFLLAGRKRWGELLSSAVVTALCWIGFGVVARFYWSSMVISNDQQYGKIGVVFAMMTWLLAAGVVLILGPVVGTAWSEWRRARQTAAKRGPSAEIDRARAPGTDLARVEDTELSLLGSRSRSPG